MAEVDILGVKEIVACMDGIGMEVEEQVHTVAILLHAIMVQPEVVITLYPDLHLGVLEQDPVATPVRVAIIAPRLQGVV